MKLIENVLAFSRPYIRADVGKLRGSLATLCCMCVCIYIYKALLHRNQWKLHIGLQIVPITNLPLLSL